MPKQCSHTTCNHNVFGGGYCRNHQYLRPDKKIRVPKPRPPINKVSKKYGKQLRLYAKRVKIWKEENPFCAYPGCGRPTDHCHHDQGRGINLNNEITWVPLCAEHHHEVEINPLKAKELKLSASRLEKHTL